MPFLSGYTKRKQITIDHANVDSDLSNFPLLVAFTDDADIGADIDSSGYNIRFTSSDGETLLKYERQSFDNGGSTATGRFWVKVPTVAGASNTTIYIYYKSASPSDGQDAANVWDSNFSGVWHLEQDPSGSAPQILDSTGNNNDLTSSGSMTSGDLVAAKVGYGLDLDGTDDYIGMTSPSNFPVIEGPLTMEIWFKTPSLASHEILFSLVKDDTGGAGNSYHLELNTGFRYLTAMGWGVDTYVDSGVELSTDTWYYGASTRDGSDHEIFLDGTSRATNTNSAQSGSVGVVRIGSFNTAYPTPYWNGQVDEARISKVVRSDAWIKFTYHNIHESDHEISFSSEETSGGGSKLLLNSRRLSGIPCQLPRGGRAY